MLARVIALDQLDLVRWAGRAHAELDIAQWCWEFLLVTGADDLDDEGEDLFTLGLPWRSVCDGL